MKTFIAAALVSLCIAAAAGARDLPAWRGHCAHTVRAPRAGQPLATIHWTMSVDHVPPSRPHKGIGGDELLIHYASPMITARSTVLV